MRQDKFILRKYGTKFTVLCYIENEIFIHHATCESCPKPFGREFETRGINEHQIAEVLCDLMTEHAKIHLN